MLTGLLKLLTAAAIAFGIVFFVTGGDLTQVRTAAVEAYTRTSESKAKNIAARDAEPVPPKPEGRINVVVREGRSETIRNMLELSGETVMSRSVAVRSETSGIVAFAPRKGTRVWQGDLLCRMELGDRGARRAATLARLSQAETEFRTRSQLNQRGVASANAVASARSNMDVLRAELAQLEVEIRRLEIYAPFNGLVDSVPVDEGSLLQPGSVCATLVDPDPIRIVASVAEKDLPELTLGTPARARLATGERVAGRIVYISQTADAATRTFAVEVELPNPDYTLRAAVSAEIDIPLLGQTAMQVPQSALTLGPDGRLGVMTVEAGSARFKPVELLRDNDSGAWVGGLSAAARIIVVGQEYVSEGTPVDVTVQTGDILGSDS